MQILMAHLREQSTSGGWIDFAVFDAKSNSGRHTENNRLLNDLTIKARAAGFKVDQSALAYRKNGRIEFFGPKTLLAYLSRRGVPRWTHKINM